MRWIASLNYSWFQKHLKCTYKIKMFFLIFEMTRSYSNDDIYFSSSILILKLEKMRIVLNYIEINKHRC